jgi:hypothetical protein
MYHAQGRGVQPRFTCGGAVHARPDAWRAGEGVCRPASRWGVGAGAAWSSPYRGRGWAQHQGGLRLAHPAAQLLPGPWHAALQHPFQRSDAGPRIQLQGGWAALAACGRQHRPRVYGSSLYGLIWRFCYQEQQQASTGCPRERNCPWGQPWVLPCWLVVRCSRMPGGWVPCCSHLGWWALPLAAGCVYCCVRPLPK